MAGLYLHIPFCEHKCIYCDFYSLAPGEDRRAHEGLIGLFLDALEREIVLRRTPPFTSETVETVFFGGGTPSLLPPARLRAILHMLRSSFPVAADAEITLELNPGTVDRAKLAAFRDAGVNRLSIGIQSFHADDLKFLTRIHSAEQASSCVRDAFDAGFTNISLDLIFSLPGQTIDRWRSNLEQAVALGPAHLSCYSLIVEPDTPLFGMVQSGHVSVLPDDDDAALYEFTMEFLASRGFEQYEVSNFARNGMRSRHNSGYWDHSNYLGFGPSAHSFWSDVRWWNVAHLQTYIEQLQSGAFQVAGEERLTPGQLMEEAIFLGLRGAGIDLDRFCLRFGRELRTEYKSLIERFVSEGLAREHDGMLSLTPRGYLVCDELCQAFR